MIADKTKIEFAMARKCISRRELALSAGLTEASVKNTMYGRSVRPITIGKIAKALDVDIATIMQNEPQEDLT